MTAPHAGLERRVVASLDAAPSRVPVVLGGCGSGRTTLLHALADRFGRTSCQYIDVERSASTPERFHDALLAASPFVDPAATAGPSTPSSARDAFDRTLAFLQRARTPDGQAATFLLDEVLELRTFENFPGLRHVLRELVQAIADSPNRFVCSSRYMARAHRVLELLLGLLGAEGADGWEERVGGLPVVRKALLAGIDTAVGQAFLRSSV
jgi:hypothetical protein